MPFESSTPSQESEYLCHITGVYIKSNVNREILTWRSQHPDDLICLFLHFIESGTHQIVKQLPTIQEGLAALDFQLADIALNGMQEPIPEWFEGFKASLKSRQNHLIRLLTGEFKS
jgi:hypothetical protein